MRVAIDARLLTGRFTGDRTYWLGLLRAMIPLLREEELLLFTDKPLTENALPPSPHWREIVIPSRSGRWWSLFTFPRAARQWAVDIAHLQYSVSPLFRCPVVTTVHDVSFLVGPQWFAWKDRWLLRFSVPASCRRAARVLTVSETSREDILKHIPLPPEKVVATPLGLPDGFYPIDKVEAQARIREKYGVEPPYAISVGVLQPRKNWTLALQAVSEARKLYGLPLRLLLLGKAGWLQQALEREIAKLNAGEWLVKTGYVPDEHLVYFYNAADALLFPSYYEGFGLPPLEAMACGTPVIASNGGALPEVVGSAGILLPPAEPGLWANALQVVFNEPEYRERMREEGLRRAQQFDWKQTAAQTLAVYREAGFNARK